MNIGELIDESFYLSDNEDGGNIGTIGAEYLRIYLGKIYPRILQEMPKNFVEQFEMEQFGSYLLANLEYDILHREVTLFLVREGNYPDEKKIIFPNAYPVKVWYDNELIPEMKGTSFGDPRLADMRLLGGLRIFYSSMNNVTKPKSERPYRCTFLTGKRFKADITFAMLEMQKWTPEYDKKGKHLL